MSEEDQYIDRFRCQSMRGRVATNPTASCVDTDGFSQTRVGEEQEMQHVDRNRTDRGVGWMGRERGFGSIQRSLQKAGAYEECAPRGPQHSRAVAEDCKERQYHGRKNKIEKFLKKSTRGQTCKVQVPERGVAWGSHQPCCTQLLSYPSLHTHSQPLLCVLSEALSHAHQS